jgi:hypothetical protein
MSLSPSLSGPVSLCCCPKNLSIPLLPPAISGPSREGNSVKGGTDIAFCAGGSLGLLISISVVGFRALNLDPETRKQVPHLLLMRKIRGTQVILEVFDLKFSTVIYSKEQ